MRAKKVTAILNVSDVQASFAWFEKLGWKEGWRFGNPPTYGAVCSGECEIMLCEGAQGGRGKSDLPVTTGVYGAEAADKGVWLWVLVDNVDTIHRHCLEQGLEVTWPPTDEPWGSREMHVRHPDGHVIRLAHGIGEEE